MHWLCTRSKMNYAFDTRLWRFQVISLLSYPRVWFFFLLYNFIFAPWMLWQRVRTSIRSTQYACTMSNWKLTCVPNRTLRLLIAEIRTNAQMLFIILFFSKSSMSSWEILIGNSKYSHKKLKQKFRKISKRDSLMERIVRQKIFCKPFSSMNLHCVNGEVKKKFNCRHSFLGFGKIDCDWII